MGRRRRRTAGATLKNNATARFPAVHVQFSSSVTALLPQQYRVCVCGFPVIPKHFYIVLAYFVDVAMGEGRGGSGVCLFRFFLIYPTLKGTNWLFVGEGGGAVGLPPDAAPYNPLRLLRVFVGREWRGAPPSDKLFSAFAGVRGCALVCSCWFTTRGR